MQAKKRSVGGGSAQSSNAAYCLAWRDLAWRRGYDVPPDMSTPPLIVMPGNSVFQLYFGFAWTSNSQDTICAPEEYLLRDVIQRFMSGLERLSLLRVYCYSAVRPKTELAVSQLRR